MEHNENIATIKGRIAMIVRAKHFFARFCFNEIVLGNPYGQLSLVPNKLQITVSCISSKGDRNCSSSNISQCHSSMQGPPGISHRAPRTQACQNTSSKPRTKLLCSGGLLTMLADQLIHNILYSDSDSRSPGQYTFLVLRGLQPKPLSTK
jgi:hypothetical protein